MHYYCSATYGWNLFQRLGSNFELILGGISSGNFFAMPLLNNVKLLNAYYLLVKDFLPIVFAYKYIKILV